MQEWKFMKSNIDKAYTYGYQQGTKDTNIVDLDKAIEEFQSFYDSIFQFLNFFSKDKGLQALIKTADNGTNLLNTLVGKNTSDLMYALDEAIDMLQAIQEE